jgi:hypothetical protein
MKKQLYLTIVLLCLVSPAAIGQISTIANGEWSSPSVWSGDQVPSPADKIVIRHRVHHNSGITIQSTGTLTIEKGGKLSMDGKLWNYGTVVNNDSLDFDVLENLASFTNSGFMQCSGNFINRDKGTMYHSGHLDMEGELMQEGFLHTTGTAYILGDLENRGETYSPPGKTGRFDVCGNAKHYPAAIVTGTVFLCMHCNGIYVRHSGAINDFNQDCGAFPVVLEDFQASVESPGEVQLTWRTASESNSHEFVIERATIAPNESCFLGKCSNTIDFKQIARIPAAGNSTTPRNYQFMDRAVPSGMNYYRLRMEDADGSVAISYIIEVLMVQGKSILEVYPNPTNDILHIRIFEEHAAEAQLSMYDISGREIWKHNISVSEGLAEMNVQVCGFAAGVYIIVYKQGDQKQTKKVIFTK